MSVNIPETLRALAKHHNDRAEPETTIALRYAAAEIEELRAAICDRFEIHRDEHAEFYETIWWHHGAETPAVAATIMHVLKQQEQRNEH